LPWRWPASWRIDAMRDEARCPAVLFCECAGMLSAPGGDRDWLAAALAGCSVRQVRQLCGGQELDSVATWLKQTGSDRILVVGCHPGWCRDWLSPLSRRVGLPPERFRWVDARGELEAFGRVPEILRRRLERAIRRQLALMTAWTPPRWERARFEPTAVVVGAGLAGLQTALALAGAGLQVTLLERQLQLGGWLALPAAYPAGARLVREVAAQIEHNPRVRVLLGHRADGVTGRLGCFRVRAWNSTGAPTFHEASFLVVATGFQSRTTVPADLAEYPQVLSSSQLDKLLAEPTGPAAMGRLRGARVAVVADPQGTAAASVVRGAFRRARRLQEEFAAEVVVFCRHAKVDSAGLEEEYRDLRQAGVTVVKLEAGPPVFRAADGRVTAQVQLPSLGFKEPVSFWFDLVIFAEERELDAATRTLLRDVGLQGGGEYAGRAQLHRLGVRAGPAGIWLVGSCRDDLEPWECRLDAWEAAGDVVELLAAGDRQVLVTVDDSRCARCLTCVRVCGHRAVQVERDPDQERPAARPLAAACEGCGACVAACPAGALELASLSGEGLRAALGAGNGGWRR